MACQRVAGKGQEERGEEGRRNSLKCGRSRGKRMLDHTIPLLRWDNYSLFKHFVQQHFSTSKVFKQWIVIAREGWCVQQHFSTSIDQLHFEIHYFPFVTKSETQICILILYLCNAAKIYIDRESQPLKSRLQKGFLSSFWLILFCFVPHFWDDPKSKTLVQKIILCL